MFGLVRNLFSLRLNLSPLNIFFADQDPFYWILWKNLKVAKFEKKFRHKMSTYIFIIAFSKQLNNAALKPTHKQGLPNPRNADKVEKKIT